LLIVCACMNVWYGENIYNLYIYIYIYIYINKYKYIFIYIPPCLALWRLLYERYYVIA